MKKEKIYYRYKAFNTLTIESLCNDEIYFANPSSFNDPLDCSFTIKCDSEDINEIRQLYSFLFRRRRNSEILLSLKNAKINNEQMRESAIKEADIEVLKKLEEFAYFATDTENYHQLTKKQAEKHILQSQIKEEIKKHYSRGVACFSSVYTCPVLWSHYGNQHEGICIGYSTNRNPIPIMQTVTYGGSRSINMSTLINAFLHNDAKAQSDLDQDILLRKAKEWKYEKESRLIGLHGIQDSPLSLSEITFGLRCSDVVKHIIMKVLNSRDQKVNYYQIQTKPNSYSLNRVKINYAKHEDYVPKTARSAEEIFNHLFEDTEI